MALSKKFEEKLEGIRLQREEALASDRKLLSEIKTLKSEINVLKSVKVEINDSGQQIMKTLLDELKSTSSNLKNVSIPDKVRRMVTLGDHAKDRLWAIVAVTFFFSISSALTAGYFWNENKKMVNQVQRNERVENDYRKLYDFYEYMSQKKPKDTKAFFEQNRSQK